MTVPRAALLAMLAAFAGAPTPVVSATRPFCRANYIERQWALRPYPLRISDTAYWCALTSSHSRHHEDIAR